MKNCKLFWVFALMTLLGFGQMWAEPHAVFRETFDECKGTGGNDDVWSGNNIANATLTTDNVNWTFVNGKGASQCAKIGTSSNSGSAETPAIALSGTTTATLTFKAAAWSANSEKTTLKLSFTECEGDQSSVEMLKGEWSTYTVQLSNITDDIKIKFEGQQKNSSRFFLDEVVVTLVEDTPEPEPVIGHFSISETQQVEFAHGNLQFHMKDSLWRIAPNQYDWIGTANIEVGNPNYDGWIDLLSWSLGQENNYGATSNYDTMTYVNKTFVDWGDIFETEDWFTMSRDQWNYLLNNRAGANDKWSMAMIGDTLGMILLPDEWTAPEGISFVPQTVPTSELWSDNDMIDNTYDHYRVHKDSMPANKYSLEQWAQLENAGAVFLPYAGRRSGGYGNYLNKDCQTVQEMYRFEYYENYLGTYWTSTLHNAAKGQADYVYTFKHSVVGGEEQYDWGKAVIWSENGRYGQSVRLVRLVENEPTGLEQITNDQQPKANKFIKDGQIFIERNGEIYTVTGQLVR